MKLLCLPIAVCAALPLVALAACSGGGSSSGVFPAAGPALTSSQTAAVTTRETSSTASAPVPDVAASSDLLYVSNVSNNSISVYRHDAQGDAAPVHVIAGSKTLIQDPSELSQDAAGNLYVANGASILVFAHGADGNVAPLRVLAGSKTGFGNAQAVTVDKSTGKIFVGDRAFSSTLLRFAPNAAGNVPPFAAQSSFPAFQLVSDSSGQNLIEADEPLPFDGWSVQTATIPKQFANNSDTNPIDDLESFPSFGVADDPTTKTYLVSSSDGIYRFNEKTNGLGPDNYGGVPAHYSPPPLAVISSAPNCGQLALGYLRNIYAVCGDAIKVFAPTATGAAAPLRTLSGAATRLSGPAGIYEGV